MPKAASPLYAWFFSIVQMILWSQRFLPVLVGTPSFMSLLETSDILRRSTPTNSKI